MTVDQIKLGAIPKKSYVNATVNIIMSKDMRNLATTDYVKTVVQKNNIRSEPTQQPNSRPEICNPMEKMASIIGIKNINWCDVRQHHNNNFAMKANDGY